MNTITTITVIETVVIMATIIVNHMYNQKESPSVKWEKINQIAWHVLWISYVVWLALFLSLSIWG